MHLPWVSAGVVAYFSISLFPPLVAITFQTRIPTYSPINLFFFFYSAPLLISNLFVVVMLLESCIKSLVVVPTPVLGTK